MTKNLLSSNLTSLNHPLEKHTQSLSARESEKRGAEGLFYAAQSSLDGVGLKKR